MYKIKLEQFEGPLDLLLQLIEKNELDITQVSLATVTEQFIQELEKVEQLSPDELSDFLVVAAKLLYIKSKSLLPRNQNEEDDAGLDLEHQLKMYRMYYEASKLVNKIWLNKKIAYPRIAPTVFRPVFMPPKNVTAQDLADVFQGVIAGITPIVNLNEGIVIKSINIREKIFEIRELIKLQPFLMFHSLVEKVKTKTEMIVTFLAMLELVKQRSITLTQDNSFSEIKITCYPTDSNYDN
ncbi:MAG: ScpA family protein [bacterium]